MIRATFTEVWTNHLHTCSIRSIQDIVETFALCPTISAKKLLLSVIRSFVLDFVAKYVEMNTTVLSADPAVVVPLLTINGWIVMQRMVTGGSVSFYQYIAAYRDGFGSATGNDNYWLGLNKIYLLTEPGSATLRIEVDEIFASISDSKIS